MPVAAVSPANTATLPATLTPHCTAVLALRLRFRGRWADRWPIRSGGACKSGRR